MSYVDLHGVEWASMEDAVQAQADAVLYGTMFVKRDDDGRLRRIDPTTVTFAETTPAAE